MKALTRILAPLVLLATLAGCSQDEQAPPAAPELKVLAVTVDFEQIGDIGQSQSLVVEFVDITDGDSDAPVLASANIGTGAPTPLDVELTYDTSLVRDDRDYRVRAQLRENEITILRSAFSIDPFSDDEKRLVFSRPMVVQMPSTQSISLQGIHWHMHSIDGVVLEIPVEMRPTIFIEANGTRYSGFAGCNLYNGEYVLDGTRLQLLPGPVTRRACPEGGELETRFLALLQQVGKWQLSDGQMVLADENREELARFVMLEQR